MAYYAALVSLIQLLKDLTHDDRYSSSFLDKQQVHIALHEKFKHLQEMLDDYSPKDHKDESNDILERRIRDAAYLAQDIIESHISTPLLPHVHLEKRAERVRRHLGSTFRKPLDSIMEKKYYRDLEKVEANLDSILEELMRVKEERNTIHQDLQPDSYISVEASRVQAPSSKNNMLVLDEDLMTTIKSQLCGESSKLEVISIAGMGGLGKTTLARNIFDDRLMHDRFDCRAWVTVSQDYHLKNILLAIVSSLNINKEEFYEDGEEALRQNLYKKLYGRRYLIIMDDVWEAKFWDDIKRILPDNSNGSRVMITTRLFDVADYVSCSKFHHQMQFLDEDQSWTLLREKVLAAQEHCPDELEVIGRKIAKNCRGLPLAIVVIAGVLSNVKRSQYDWENISRKVSSTVIDQKDEHLLTILSLSYNHLPHHLKPCFLYLGGYPEDHEICISKLIRLWVAEGFLKPIESKSLEEVGEGYFKDLVNRNLVMITKKKFNGKSKFCTIHDVLRELCSQIAHDENFLLCVQRKDDFQSTPIGEVRRVYIQSDDEYSNILKYIKKHGLHVRSLMYCSPKFHCENNSISAASGCKLLRILDTRARIGRGGNAHDILYLLKSIAYEKMVELLDFSSEKIIELLHLRYLNLTVPVSSRIFHLQNLQTLIIDSHASLPSGIWKMPQLRHVISKEGVALPPIPYDEVRIIEGVPLLGSLQTLSRVGCFKFTRDTIEMIPNLKKLGLQCNCEASQKWEEHELSNVVNLHKLETLHILFGSYSWEMIPIPLPENFAFPSTLIKLSLVRCKLPWKDMSAVGSLPNLQVLKLRRNAFLGEEWEPIEGEFLKLKFLLMENLPDLKYWRAENTHFPRLEHLHITYCDALEEIPPGIGDIPTLRLIQLESYSALESSVLEIQEQQRDLGNDDLQVRVIKYGQQDVGVDAERSESDVDAEGSESDD